MKYIFIITLLTVFLTGCAQGETETYTIGVVTSLSGNGANLGIPWVQGMELAVKEINMNGGINGIPIQLVVEDDKLTPSETTTATRFLLDTKQPDILTTLFHISSEALNPLSEESRVPHLTTSFSRTVLASPYTYKINFDAFVGCEQMVQYAKDNSIYQNLGVLMSNVGYNHQCLEGAKKVDPNITEVWYNFGETDFRTGLLKLQEAGIDGIITVGIDFEYIEMFQQIQEMGYNTSFFCATASECVFNDDLAKGANDMSGDVYGIDFFNPNELPQSSFAKTYAETYEKAGGIVLTYAAIGYDQTYLLSEVFAVCTPKDVDCINRALDTYTGSGGRIIEANGFNNRVLSYNYSIYEYDKGWTLK